MIEPTRDGARRPGRVSSQLEALRSGTWGTKRLWGRVLTYKGGAAGLPAGE